MLIINVFQEWTIKEGESKVSHVARGGNNSLFSRQCSGHQEWWPSLETWSGFLSKARYFIHYINGSYNTYNTYIPAHVGEVSCQ